MRTYIHEVVIHALHRDHLHEVVLVVSLLRRLRATGIVLEDVGEQLVQREEDQHTTNPS